MAGQKGQQGLSQGVPKVAGVVLTYNRLLMVTSHIVPFNSCKDVLVSVNIFLTPAKIFAVFLPVASMQWFRDSHRLHRSCWGPPYKPRLPPSRQAGVGRSCGCHHDNADHHRFPHRHRRHRFLHRTNCCHCDRLQRVLPSSVGPVVELISAVGGCHLCL